MGLIRFFRRRGAAPAAVAGPAATATISLDPLSTQHRRQTESILQSLVSARILFDDEYDLDDVFENVALNLPDDPADPVDFSIVIDAVAHSYEPLMNLVAIPTWSEVFASDLEEITESLCWFANINTHAVAEPVAHDPGRYLIRFDDDAGVQAQLDVRVPPKGLPVELLDALAAYLAPRLAPRSIVAALTDGQFVLSALDPGTTQIVNNETSAGFEAL